MEKYVLKGQIVRAIAEKEVVAVMIHTFNFDPVFFENYLMPIFVNDKKLEFRDEEIYNRILWKDCAKKGLIPPITVYCDFYAKDNTKVPSLGYDIYCIKMPGAKNQICNFHPKQLFILLKDKKTEKESLVMITGSGNITPGGWCDNFEIFSIETINKNKNKTRSDSSNSNELQDYLDNVANLYNKNNKSDSHKAIYDFFKFVDLDKFLTKKNKKFFNSLKSSFTDFLQESEIPFDEIIELEIISPYFSEHPENIKWLQSKGITDIRCLIPRLLSNEILLKEETFLKYRDQGIQWSEWTNEELNKNKESRNVHAKIYRFHTEKTACYTIIGSVNFTNPAWREVEVRGSKKENNANVETAFLYKSIGEPYLLKKVELNLKEQTFIDKSELEGDSDPEDFNRAAPDLNFSIDWRKEELTILAKIETACKFCGMLSDQDIPNGESVIKMSSSDIKYFSKQGLIKIEVQQNGKACFYYYYANHINIESKPLGIQLSSDVILQYWEFLGDDHKKKVRFKEIAESITDVSGRIDSEIVNNKKSSLNEMAAHYVRIVKLENFLFSNNLKSIKEKKAHFKSLENYLLNNGIDTIPSYVKELIDEGQQNKKQNSFVWMVLQIFINNFYEAAILIAKEYKKEFRGKQSKEELKKLRKDLKQFEIDLKQYKGKLTSKAKDLSSEINGLKDKQDWVVNQISESYD